ncbi:MAG: hypothetical protein ACTS6J_26280 [Burkholderiales bacterium]
MIDVERIEAPIRALNEAVQRGMAPVIALSKAAERSVRRYEEMQENFRKSFEPFQAMIARMDAQARRFHESIQKAIRNSGIDFEVIARAMEEDKARFPGEMRIMAEHGWYVQPRMTPRQHREICRALAETRTAEVEAALVNYFEAELEEIEKTLCRNTPNRARLLRSAFAAHRRKDFAASIPLMLAQADGICRDYTGGHLFADRKTLQAWVKAGKPSMLMYFAALVEVTPIIASEKVRASNPVAFNRHAIMHGESIDYDSEANGARAVSLLVYIDWVLGEITRSERAKRRC